MLAGYVLWCWRAYYLPPRIEWSEKVERADRKDIKRWIRRHARQHELRPQWSWSGAKYRLLHPYDGRRIEMTVYRDEDPYYVRSDWAGYVQYVELSREGDAWRVRELTWEQSEWREMTLRE